MVALLFTFTLALAAEKPVALPPKCYTAQDVKDEGCRVLCIRDGYTGGKVYKKGCSCYDIKESLDDFTSKRVTLGVRMHTLEGNEPEPIKIHVENKSWGPYNYNEDE